jgi:hypothetical protein
MIIFDIICFGVYYDYMFSIVGFAFIFMYGVV